MLAELSIRDLNLRDCAASGALLSMAMLSGCGGCLGGEPPVDANANPSAVPVGIVEGVVRLEAGATLPEYQPPTNVNQPEPPKSCSPPKLVDRQPVGLEDGRGLSNIVIGATQFPRSPDFKPVAHDAAIRDCRLEPRVIAATRGDTIRLKNEADYPFLPELGKARLPPNAPQGGDAGNQTRAARYPRARVAGSPPPAAART